VAARRYDRGVGATPSDGSRPPEPLAGGRLGGAVRVGNTVRRTAGPWTPAVHALLGHLQRVGFAEAPRALGVDDEGREVLTFVEGETAGAPPRQIGRASCRGRVHISGGG